MSHGATWTDDDQRYNNMEHNVKHSSYRIETMRKLDIHVHVLYVYMYEKKIPDVVTTDSFKTTI